MKILVNLSVGDMEKVNNIFVKFYKDALAPGWNKPLSHPQMTGVLPSAINFDIPDLSKVFGLSTSQYSGVVDFKKAKAAGVKFVIIKALHGMLKSQYLDENYQGAVDAGIVVFLYAWLCTPNMWISAGGQGRKFADLLTHYPMASGAFIDFEPQGGRPANNPNTSVLYGMYQPLRMAYRGFIGIYTGQGYWNQYGSVNPIWKSADLWQARYKAASPLPILPWGMDWRFWQWSETCNGETYGVPKTGEIACEGNYYNGTETEFLARYGLAPLPVPPVSPDPELDMFTAWLSAHPNATGYDIWRGAKGLK